jgi:hypothetical protein
VKLSSYSGSRHFLSGKIVFAGTLACFGFLLVTVYLLPADKMASPPVMPSEAQTSSHLVVLAALRPKPSQLLLGHLDHDQISCFILLD